jgi:hypothetical protein
LGRYIASGDGRQRKCVRQNLQQFARALVSSHLFRQPQLQSEFSLATIDHIAQQLYAEQDDDDDGDGLPLDATSRVTYEAFDFDPGNPEYLVRVEDGPLAGQTGYVVDDELETSQTGAFRLVEP